MRLCEELFEGDLENLVNHIFEIDSYTSKMGEDKDIVVIGFKVNSLEPAKDLVNFLERGYDFILDADYTPGELADGKYKVFAEIERNRRIADQIVEMLDGMKKLTNITEFKFRYYKSFHSAPATIEELRTAIPTTPNEYEIRSKQDDLNNFSNFFNRSYIESIEMDNNDIVFQKKYAEPLRMRMCNYGPKHQVYNNVQGRIMMEQKDIAEIMYFTKYIGHYNITKVGNEFIFENGNYAISVKKDK